MGNVDSLEERMQRLARSARCPRCDADKTFGAAICRICRNKLPANISRPLQHVDEANIPGAWRALRAAANYFRLHLASVRHFGGGSRRR
jgi:predicted amidophosphoribosyltransferase